MPEEAVEFLMGRVSYATPSSCIKALPESTKADGQPLLEERVRLLKLRQAQSYHIALKTHLLEHEVCIHVVGGGGMYRSLLKIKRAMQS